MAKIKLIPALAKAASSAAEFALETIWSKRGAKNGIATLDANGKIPAEQLPDGLDELVEVDITWTASGDVLKVVRVNDNADLTNMLKENIIYVNTTESRYENNLYRWTGSILTPCPLFTKTENLTVDFEEAADNTASTAPTQIKSGETLATLFAKLSHLGKSFNYIFSMFSSLSSSYGTHVSDTSIHVPGYDSYPTANSTKLVTSGALYTRFENVGFSINEIGASIGDVNSRIDAVSDEIEVDETALTTAINNALNSI